MDYEQKYKNALERAKKELSVCGSQDCDAARQIFRLFPELAESEDERIRKELIDAIQGLWDNDALPLPLTTKRKDEWLTWLEKQSEQPKEFTYTHEVKVGNGNIKGLVTEKVQLPKFKVGDHVTNGYYRCRIESIDDTTYYCNFTNIDIKNQDKWMLVEQETDFKPKFHGGDWIVWQDKCYKVNYNGCGYELIDQNGLSTSLEYGTVDKGAHLWTIQDAKDGDVLASELCDSIILFKGIKDNKIDFYCDYDFSEIGASVPGDRFAVNNRGEHYGDVEDSEDFHPATKEQRELLFQRMKEAGYEWNTESKELKNVIIKPKFNVGDCVVDKYGIVIQILSYKDGVYKHTNGYCAEIFEDEWRMWTIQDAKDGDMLCSPYCKLLWLYKDKKTCYVGYNYHSGSIVVNSPICIPIDARPATKEECDTLMKAMADAGYEWVSEKKLINHNKK